MKYYAKVYTGNPATGLIVPGEMLTEKQVEQLGEEKILELCARGVLGYMAEKTPAPKQEAPAPVPEAEQEEKTEKPDCAEDGSEDPADEDEQEAEPNGEDAPAESEIEEELPELGDGEDLVSDGEAEPEPEKPAKKTTKSSKGRK